MDAYQCDFCPMKSPNEDLAISHAVDRHLDSIKKNKNWHECVLCFKFLPIWKEHSCWDTGICPLCSAKVCIDKKHNKKIFHHMRTKHYEEIKVRLIYIFYYCWDKK